MTAEPGSPDPTSGADQDDLTRFHRSVVDGLADVVAAFDEVGEIVFINEAARTLMGWDPAWSLVGRSIFEFFHPEDLERAARAMDFNREFGSAPGATIYRLLHADGTWVYVDMTGGHASDDGQRLLYSATSRRADDRNAILDTMERLLSGEPIANALRRVLDVFSWASNGSHVGVSWVDGEGNPGAVSTGIDLVLVGAPGTGAPAAGETPWDEARRTGESFTAPDLAGLDPARRARAEAAGMGAFWIEPVAGGSDARALITIWTREGGRPPRNHVHGMATVEPIVELILRWSEQQRQLDFAAFHDPLTGVANRTAFFDALASCPGGGAVLYCDLDRFKPVNDEHGHAAGDDLLRGVAHRLGDAVRSGDLVARLGGDEFAVLCPGGSGDDASALVDRIERALAAPFAVAGTEVTIGVSIGVGLAEGRIGDDTLDVADQALYRAKGERRRADPPG